MLVSRSTLISPGISGEDERMIAIETAFPVAKELFTWFWMVGVHIWHKACL